MFGIQQPKPVHHTPVSHPGGRMKARFGLLTWTGNTLEFPSACLQAELTCVSSNFWNYLKFSHVGKKKKEGRKRKALGVRERASGTHRWTHLHDSVLGTELPREQPGSSSSTVYQAEPHSTERQNSFWVIRTRRQIPSPALSLKPSKRKCLWWEEPTSWILMNSRVKANRESSHMARE